jgi:hypothetical protein
MKYNTTQIIKHTSHPAPTPAGFGTKVPIPREFITVQDLESNLYTFTLVPKHVAVGT